jgi:hypothetical protein
MMIGAATVFTVRDMGVAGKANRYSATISRHVSRLVRRPQRSGPCRRRA